MDRYRATRHAAYSVNSPIDPGGTIRRKVFGVRGRRITPTSVGEEE